MSVRLFKIKEIKNQNIIHGIFHCKYKELKKTKYGDPYIAVGLMDASGNIEGKLWQNSKYYGKLFDEGDIVAIKGSPNLYRKNIELNILHASKYRSAIYDKYGFDSKLITPKIEIDSVFLWKEISKYFNQAGDSSEIIKSIYKDCKQNIVTFPYSIDAEPQLEGSYLNNIYKALKIFNLLSSATYQKNTIDSDLAYSLIFLINFHVITGYEKNIIYALSKDSIDRGSINIFHDYFKKYKKLTSKKMFSTLEKYIFDSSAELPEKRIVSEIFKLVEHAG